jgi:hypothetical protein
MDPLGKGLAQMLLDMQVRMPASLEGEAGGPSVAPQADRH